MPITPSHTPDQSTTPTVPRVNCNVEQLLYLKRRQLDLLRLKTDAVRRDGLPFYHPHPKQDLFHRSMALRRGAFTGNRFGKSTMGLAEDCAWLRNERPWYPKSDAARTSGIPQRPVKGLIIANDWDKVDEIFTGKDGKLWRFLPSDFIKSVHRNHSGAVDTLHCNNRSSLRFDTVKSFMSNPQGSESSDWDFIHVDEPCPEGMFQAQARGLVDRRGAAWFTLTALMEPWIIDAFDSDGIFNGISFSMEGTIYDNARKNGGYLSDEAIQDFEKTLTPDLIECRLYGKPLHKAGLVYKEFQRDVHVLNQLPSGWTSWIEPPKDYSYYLYIDPHPHVPTMVLFCCVDKRGRLYFYHDIFQKRLIGDLCGQIKSDLGGRKVARVRCDPIAFIEDPKDGTTWADDFVRHGLAVTKASKDLSRGIVRVQECLRDKSFHPYFTPAARRTLWEITRYHWNPETNKPVDQDDHAMECLYRAILDQPQWIPPQDTQSAVEDIVILGPTRRELTHLEDLPVEEVAVGESMLMLN